MTKPNFHCALATALLTAFAVAPPTLAQSLPQGANSVIRLNSDIDSNTQVQVGAYYTQVQIRANGFKIPSDDNGRKMLGKAILAAFGLGSKVKSLTISAIISQGGQNLPEIPIITYSFDGNRKITSYEVVNSYISPRWQLGATDVISMTLNYKYSEQTSYSPTTITTNVQKLIPSEAITSALGAPFIQGVAELTASVFEIAGSRSVTARSLDNLLPYSGTVGARALNYTLALPDGTSLGAINATLAVSPSLLRPAILATAATTDDLRRKDGEDVASLALHVGGAKKKLLQEIEGLPAYTALAKSPSNITVREYCTKARDTLSEYSVTAMDRTTLIYRSMQNAGLRSDIYHPDANTWGTVCFSDIDQDVLKKAINANFTPPPPPKPPIVAAEDRWPKTVKSAMGCWVTNKNGDWCTKNAPEARTTLDKAFASKVNIGLLELFPEADQAAIPVGRAWDKYSLIAALSAKADEFSCFEAGLILTKGGIPYVVGVELKDDLISTIQIQKATEEAARCLKS